jgi:hypothetical protein
VQDAVAWSTLDAERRSGCRGAKQVPCNVPYNARLTVGMQRIAHVRRRRPLPTTELECSPGPRARGRRIALDRQASARRPPARIPAPSGLRLCVTGVALFALARTRSRPQQTRRCAQHHGTVAPHCCAVRSLSSTNTWRDSLASTESEIECDPAWDQWVRNSR